MLGNGGPVKQLVRERNFHTGNSSGGADICLTGTRKQKKKRVVPGGLRVRGWAARARARCAAAEVLVFRFEARWNVLLWSGAGDDLVSGPR